MHRIAAITFIELDPASDADALVMFLATNTFPFHRRPRLTPAEADDASRRCWAEDRLALWVVADGSPIGVAVVTDLDDVADGGAPMFDLRLAEGQRGCGLGAPVLRALTDLVFDRWPNVTRFEGHTRADNLAMRATFRRAGWVKEAFHRDAWPVEAAPPEASVAYAVLRCDWRSGTTTPVVWDDV